jgi:hypothetical protein
MEPPKPDEQQPIIEAEVQPQKRPATLGKMKPVRVTPEELAARRKADEEEEARRREARMRPKTGPVAAVAPPGAPPMPHPSPAAAPTAPSSGPMFTPPGAPTASPAAAGAAARAADFAPAQGPVLARLMEAAVPLLGTEGKHITAVCAMASKLATELGAKPESVELVGPAVQALYVASQLDRRGPYAPPELATLQKLLGSTWEELGPLVEPCAKGGLTKAKFERREAAAIAAAVCFFNQTRNPAAPAPAAKAALQTLRAQKLIPAEALDALASAVAG